MNPDTAVQSFELRRFPNSRSPVVRILWFYLALLAWSHWLRGLLLIGVVLSYWFWQKQRPADVLRLSKTEIHLHAGLLLRLQIQRRDVQEVSMASQGVIIAWKKSGVPHYTYVNAAWFEDVVWRKTCPALLAWGRSDQV